jgi:hypothetical protein
MTESQLAIIRDIRAWHWKEIFRHRKNQYRLERQVLNGPGSVSRAEIHKKSADFHTTVVNRLNVFFAFDDTADNELENGNGKPTP